MHKHAKYILAFTNILLVWLFFPYPSIGKEPVQQSQDTSRCLMCHTSRHPGIVADWKSSKHFSNGVGCAECHKVNTGTKGAIENHFGFTVSPSVSPKKCSKCHAAEFKSFENSSHALSFNPIANVAPESNSDIGKKIMFEQSCAKCHDIGRINNDNSRGNCAACHTRHSFSLAKVRLSETCTKCHTGNNTPAMRAWLHSKHGSSASFANDKVNFSKKHFIPSVEGVKQPNCYVCHIAAYSKDDTGTHNVSERLSWHINTIKSNHKKDWKNKRNEMKSVCLNCHSSHYVNNFYHNFDQMIEECNRWVDKNSSQIASMTKSMKNKVRIGLVKCKLGTAMMCPALVLEGQQMLDSINDRQKVINAK